MALKPKLASKKKITAEDTLGISVQIFKENADGSANAQVMFSKEGLETLVQWGLVSMLAAAVDEYRVRPEKDSEIIVERTEPTKAKPMAKKGAKK
jgi:hypothetical protein